MPQFLVTGLSELRNVLIKADQLEPKEMRVLMKTIAEPLAEHALVRLNSIIHDPRSTGQLASTLKAASTVRSASVVLGTPKRTAYGGWWEFGGPRAKSFAPPNRDYVKEGRSLYPSLAEARPEIQAKTELVMETLANLIIAEG